MSKDSETIGMLLDIDHIYGEHSGRMAPLAAVLAVGAIPPLIYIYTGLYYYVPIPIFIIIMLILIIRAIMLFPGRERDRKNIFKKRLHNDYTGTEEYMNIRTVHPDGCIEYLNGRIMYLVACYNGTSENDLRRCSQLTRLLENMIYKYEYDTYILNINDAPALREYYEKVKLFPRNGSAKNFIDIIDYSLEKTSDASIVMCTVYAIKGNKSDWKEIKTLIDTAVESKQARCYKTIYRVSDPDVINDLLNRDIDSVINISDLLRRKYATENFATSRVLAYDLPEDKEILQGAVSMNPIIPEATSHSFHQVYKED